MSAAPEGAGAAAGWRGFARNALALVGALALVALSAAAFLAYLRPELLLAWANRILLCY